MLAPDQDVLRARRHKTTRSIIALVLREMSTTYGRSLVGYAWAILEPVAAIALLSVAFQFAFRSPALGSNFPFYFATGFLPFAMTVELASKIGSSLRFSKALLAYPAVRFIDAIIARTLLCVLTNLMVMAIVLTGIHVIFDINSIIDPSSIMLSIGMAVAVGLGVGCLNCFLFSEFPAWERVWQVITRPLVLVSGVIFFYDTMPAMLQTIMWYNPLTHVVGAMRRGFFATYDATHVTPVYVMSVAMITGGFGLLLLYRHHKELMDK